MNRPMKIISTSLPRTAWLAALALAALPAISATGAQGAEPAAAAAGSAAPAVSAAPPANRPPPAPARARAPFDPTGYWVSVITEDWRYRMVVPGKGEYADVPLTLEAKQFADAWTPDADEAAGAQCKAYGAAAIMRVPTRLHIMWQDDNTLKVETDAGQQTRLLMFKPSAADLSAPPSNQGISVASWVMAANPPPPPPGGRAADMPRFGSLRVQVSNMTAGYLRKNGIPYSGDAKMTEYWDIYPAPNGDRWLVVESELTDPRYLQVPYVLSSHFKHEASAAKWDPSPCTLRQ